LRTAKARSLLTLFAAVASVLSVLYMSLWQWTEVVPQPNVPLLGGLLGPEAFVGTWRGEVTPVLALGWLGAVSYCYVRFFLWWLGRGRPGASLLLVAAALGALPLLFQTFFLVAAFTGICDAAAPVVVLVVHVFSSWGWLLPVVTLILFGIGLIRTRLVPVWVGALAVITGAGLALFAPERGGATGGDGYLLAVAAECVFLLALAGCLALRLRSGSTAESESATTPSVPRPSG